MKNIFSNFGTKKVAGVVLAGATLLVGLGVVSNFSGDSQKANNEAALSRFANGSYNSASVGGSRSASRADLERQMAAGQDGYSARFLKGRSDGTEAEDAFSSDGAYAEGVRGANSPYGPGADGAYGANGGAYTNGDVYDPFGSTYEQGDEGLREAGSATPGDTRDAVQQFQDIQNAAAAAGKGAKGKGGKGGEGAAAGGRQGVRPATQINKLSTSKGGSSFGSGGAGGARGGGSSFGTGTGATGGDNNTHVLPPTNVGKTGDGNSFKLGRAGGMGGFNVGFNGKEVKGGNNRGTGAASDLQLAAAYSKKAVSSSQSEGQKSLAEAAFDGSNPEDLAPTIPEDASIAQVASNLMDGSKLNLPSGESLIPPEVEDNLKEVARQQAELTALQAKLSKKLLWMIGTVTAMAIALFFLVRAFYTSDVWTKLGWLIASIALSAVALATIALFMWAGEDSIVNLIKRMADKDKFGLVNQGLDVGGKLNSTYGLAAALAGLLGLCWVPWSSFSGLHTIVQTIITTLMPTIATKVVSSAVTEGQNLHNINKSNKKG